ncbi:hypothetical protein JL101_035380 (plasmid) [Skermanella rosea]|uniref:hypothetical protein n=1 Tax=Skermanella rosea TaxID=1817965 RepID=UPI0019324039|nr:hypothetical protein [Skermanella rosea]UEM08081.1 hypothetical protein JL101_035380 [Skermanella rosea]
MDRVSAHICGRFPGNTVAQEYYGTLWREYDAAGLADTTFVDAIASGDDGRFWQRVWEMLLARHLCAQGRRLTSADHGPDFRFEAGGKVVWCEAICPEPVGIPAECLRVPSAGEFRVVTVPAEAMLLRWTAAIKEKREKLEGRNGRNRRTGVAELVPGYRQQGIVADDECYVIAVNGSRLSAFGMWEAASTLPIILQAVLPIGPIQVPVRGDRIVTEEARHSYRASVPSRNGSPVPTDSFLDPSYAGVSAVMGSVRSDEFNGGLDIVVVHNPLARAALPVGVLGAAREYVPHDLGGGEYEFVPVRAGGG